MLHPLGLKVPLHTTEHHEMIAETIPLISELNHALPAMRDNYAFCNVRQERNGLLRGT